MKIQFYPFINKKRTDLSENTGKIGLLYLARKLLIILTIKEQICAYSI